MANQSAAFEVQNLTVSIESRLLVGNLNFRLDPGHCLVILGPNGVGKTTLIRTLTGYLKPETGRVLIQGESIHAMSGPDRCHALAWVPQNEDLQFNWTAEEFVALGRVAKNSHFFETPADRACITAALDRVGMTHMHDRPVQNMSGGERQLVRIARGLAQEANCLILDEPTAHLDIAFQAQVLQTIHHLQAEDLTLIVSLHDLNQAFALNASYLLIQDQAGHFFETAEALLDSKRLQQTYEIPLNRVVQGDGSLSVLPDFGIRD